MDHSLDEVSVATREAVRGVLARQPGRGAVRAAEPLGHDKALWEQLCAVGLAGLGVPETRGGGGADLLALVVAAQELGRILAPVPFAEHAAAARLLAVLAPDHPDLPDVTSGELIITLAPRARDGVAEIVPAGAVADIVLALDAGELVAVRSAPPFQAVPNLGAFPVADRDLQAGDRTVLAGGAAARAAWDAAEREWFTLVSGWLTGLSAAALELVTDWVKQRYQFGVPIGSFQGVQHGLADLPGLVEGAELLAGQAAWSQDTGLRSLTGARGGDLALMALVFSADTARQVTARAVQYHGGLGVAEEHDAQLFFRRARAYPLLTGAPRQQLCAVGDAALAEVAG